MLQAINFVVRSLIVTGLLSSGQVFGATRLEPLTVGYSNITATYAPLWIAVEERVGRQVRVGLEGDLRRPSTTAAVARHR